VGVALDGTLNVLIMTGSLQNLVVAHRNLGSERAIWLDNGGSCGVGIWTMRDWPGGKWGDANPAELPQPMFVGNGSYFRPRAHATIVLDLNSDMMEAPFLPRRMGDV